jgi:hypothetical protein
MEFYFHFNLMVVVEFIFKLKYYIFLFLNSNDYLNDKKKLYLPRYFLPFIYLLMISYPKTKN